MSLIYNQKSEYCVCVKCITYNNGAFIEDTMNGFTLQHTTFPYVCTIVDDFSTDNSELIIESYLKKNFNLDDDQYCLKEETSDYHLIFARHKTNYNCFFAVLLLKYNHYQIKKSKDQYIKKWIDSSKYIAICEGDDYWTDSEKLKKQVSFLDENPEYTMCFHSVNYVSNGITIKNDRKAIVERDFTASDIIRQGGDFCATCSFLFRSKYMFEMPTFRKMSLETGVGDWPLQILLAINGTIHYFPEVMGCYRIGNSASWSGQNVYNTTPKFNHWRSVFKWYKELDDYTNKRYHHDVYDLISRLSLTMYMHNQYSRKDLLFNIRQLNWGRSKSFFYLKLLCVDFPVLAKVAHKFHIFYPSNN